jgi:putative addiction module component (TIGR02574 family)
MPRPPSDDAFDEMSVREQIRYVQKLWDRIAEHSDDIELTDEHRAELDTRLDRLDESPEDGTSWEKVRDRLRDD